MDATTRQTTTNTSSPYSAAQTEGQRVFRKLRGIIDVLGAIDIVANRLAYPRGGLPEEEDLDCLADQMPNLSEVQSAILKDCCEQLRNLLPVERR
jgi:hypothetical protein